MCYSTSPCCPLSRRQIRMTARRACGGGGGRDTSARCYVRVETEQLEQPLIYITEMAFADPSRLAEWHAHYLRNIANLQTVPGFLASQPFQSLTDTPSPYSAMHEIASADVFDSAIYKQRGGRASNGGWQKDMGNWHPKLYSR